MGSAPMLAAGFAIIFFMTGHALSVITSGVFIAWAASPAIAWWISLPVEKKHIKFSADQIVNLRKLARKTWNFFETFVTAEDHWLPPDNFQEYPAAVIAHRTSPTNIGLFLLGALGRS